MLSRLIVRRLRSRCCRGDRGGSPCHDQDPFAFVDYNRTRELPSDAGWIVDPAVPVDFVYRPRLPNKPVVDALTFVQRIGPAAGILRSADPARRAALVDRPRVLMEAHLRGSVVDFPAAAWNWSATASLERQRP